MSELASSETVVEQESVPADPNLLGQLTELRKWERHTAALAEFLRDHHKKLLGLSWDIWPWNCEVRIRVRSCYPATTAAEIAKRFPGEWQCGVKPQFNLGEYLDWTAQRDLVRVRIEDAEVVVPVNPKPHPVTF